MLAENKLCPAKIISHHTAEDTAPLPRRYHAWELRLSALRLATTDYPKLKQQQAAALMLTSPEPKNPSYGSTNRSVSAAKESAVRLFKVDELAKKRSLYSRRWNINLTNTHEDNPARFVAPITSDQHGSYYFDFNSKVSGLVALTGKSHQEDKVMSALAKKISCEAEALSLKDDPLRSAQIKIAARHFRNTLVLSEPFITSCQLVCGTAHAIVFETLAKALPEQHLQPTDVDLFTVVFGALVATSQGVGLQVSDPVIIYSLVNCSTAFSSSADFFVHPACTTFPDMKQIRTPAHSELMQAVWAGISQRSISDNLHKLLSR